MIPAPLPAGANVQGVVYHVYQHGYVGGNGPSFTVNNFPVTYFARPILLFLQVGFWVIYLAGASKVRELDEMSGHFDMRHAALGESDV